MTALAFLLGLALGAALALLAVARVLTRPDPGDDWTPPPGWVLADAGGRDG